MEAIGRTEESELPIAVAFEATAADHYHALRDLAARDPLVSWTTIALLAAPALMIGISLAVGYPLFQAVFRNAFWIILGPLFVWVVFPLSNRVRALWAGRRNRNPRASTRVFTFDERGVRIETPDAHTQLGWSDVRQVVETRDSMLLYIGARAAAYFPVAAAEQSGTLTALRKLMRRHLGERVQLRSVSDPGEGGLA